jgi:hypothetical protein
MGRTWCYTEMSSLLSPGAFKPRAFKTSWFDKAARKARIGDPELRAAVLEAARGQADDLGGGVFETRLNRNMHRSIILAKGGQHWIFAYLFAKKDRANIDDDELSDFRKLARAYGRMTASELTALLHEGDLLGLCDEA